MRICIVVLNSIWYDPRVRKQIASYRENGIDLVCVGYECSRYNADKVKDIPCQVNVLQKDPRYLGHQHSLIKKIKREVSKNQRLCDAIVAYRPDVIHANDLDTLVACVKAARKLKCRVVYDSHEICVENYYLKGIYKKYLAWIEKRYIKYVDGMVCVSHAAADYFEKVYKIEKPMVVTNCSLRSEQYLSDKKNEGFEVLNHGQFYEGRGYDIMLEAIPYLKKYPDVKLALRGFGKMEEFLKKRAKELGDENVRFYPKVLVQELIIMASKAHVGVAMTEPVCLNFKLSVSNKLFEYAAAGLPVIMSDIPEHRYLNERFHFGIVIPDNSPKTFAEAVIKLYTDKEFYNNCVKNAKRLSDEVNWETEFERLIEFEKSLMK